MGQGGSIVGNEELIRFSGGIVFSIRASGEILPKNYRRTAMSQGWNRRATRGMCTKFEAFMVGRRGLSAA